MGSKLGFLLSLFFAIQVICLTSDLSSIQIIHSTLDTCSVTVAKKISISGGVTSEIRHFVKTNCGGTIVATGRGPYQVGDILTFQISKSFTPLIMSQKAMKITVTRSTVLGYLD